MKKTWSYFTLRALFNVFVASNLQGTSEEGPHHNLAAHKRLFPVSLPRRVDRVTFLKFFSLRQLMVEIVNWFEMIKKVFRIENKLILFTELVQDIITFICLSIHALCTHIV